uniref:(northern house mosquito) hypothetical protein n=1 Tax=Culex pipiens TaxID=7175 RepID=A0A8D8BLK6_CULPI
MTFRNADELPKHGLARKHKNHCRENEGISGRHDWKNVGSDGDRSISCWTWRRGLSWSRCVGRRSVGFYWTISRHWSRSTWSEVRAVGLAWDIPNLDFFAGFAPHRPRTLFATTRGGRFVCRIVVFVAFVIGSSAPPSAALHAQLTTWPAPRSDTGLRRSPRRCPYRSGPRTILR